jgi:hypothetical protein
MAPSGLTGAQQSDVHEQILPVFSCVAAKSNPIHLIARPPRRRRAEPEVNNRGEGVDRHPEDAGRGQSAQLTGEERSGSDLTAPAIAIGSNPLSSRSATNDVAEVVRQTLETTPRDVTHWSLRSMAKAAGFARIDDLSDLEGLQSSVPLAVALASSERRALASPMLGEPPPPFSYGVGRKRPPAG